MENLEVCFVYICKFVNKIKYFLFLEVYKGNYRGIKVAIKTLKPDSKFSIQNFLAEASVMTDLKHQNLVRLMGINIDETGVRTICLVTEFMLKVINCIPR